MPHYLFFIVPVAAIFPFLASLTIFIQRPYQPYLLYFCIFLFVNCIFDIATNMSAMSAVNNVFFNNLSQMVVMGFHLYLMREILHRQKAKRTFLYFLFAYLLLSLLNLFLVQKTAVFNSITVSFGSLFIVSACIYYFWELFQQRTFVNLIRQPAFWIASGMLFYYAVSFPLQSLLNFITDLSGTTLVNLFIIFILLNIFLYLSFTIAFLCRLKIRKSMS